MKRTIIIILCFLIVNKCFTQEDEKKNPEEIQTLLGNVSKIRGFGGPFMSFTSFNGEFAHMMGGGGGIIINDRVYFGGYGYGKTTTVVSDLSQYQDRRIDFGNGGFWMGCILGGKYALHANTGLQLGMGAISLTRKDQNNIDDPIFAITPSVELELNITRFFRMSVGGNYRYVSGVELDGYKNSDFSAPGAFLSFKFGWF